MDDRAIRQISHQAHGYSLQDHARAWGTPAGCGDLRILPEDFFVDEVLGHEPEGVGEHLYVQVEKRELNTHEVAGVLAHAADVPLMDVGYAGRKDRRAVTRQWFSIHLPGRVDPDLARIGSDRLRLLRQVRGAGKLRRGALEGNRFRIRVRNFQGEEELAVSVLESIKASGFPNYFGVQRFGRGNGNLVSAAEMLTGRRSVPRKEQGFLISAARSFLFNQVLAVRVGQGTWRDGLDGELYQLDDGVSLFSDFSRDGNLSRGRCARGEIHPTGPLWGRGARFTPRREAAAVETAAVAPFADWCSVLEAWGVAADRRALRAMVPDLHWRVEDGNWELEFFLGAGMFATSLLREWLEVRVAGSGETGATHSVE